LAGTKPPDIVLIGAGRLATNLGLALYNHGFNIIQVYNHTPEKGKKLAAKLGASFTGDISGITLHAGIYFIAVSDSALKEIASGLRLGNKLVVHTSGTTGMDVLAPVSANTGVFYPVQTFSHGRKADFRRIPVCIEASSPAAEELLADIAGQLSADVHRMDSEKRRLLHLAAVFACNFTTRMYTISAGLLEEYGIPFSLMRPLIRQTARNFDDSDPGRSQTGPAVRGDGRVLQKHREMLAAYPDYLKIYNLISDNIIKHRSAHDKL